jgi:hypothetical protein
MKYKRLIPWLLFAVAAFGVSPGHSEDIDGAKFNWSAVRKDPFWPRQTSTPVPKVRPALPLPSPASPPQHLAPTFDLRLLGTFESADGRRVVFFSRGDVVIDARAGSSLGSGYVLQSVDETRALVSHANLDRPLVLTLEAPPTQ